MQISQHKNTSRISFLILWILASIYLLLRTYFVDITDDEAWSFYNVKKFWWVETLCSGNTHWFNFAAIKVALLLGLEKAWHLRWFSVLSGILFLYIGYLWINTLKSWSVKWLAFALLFCNPYILEYLTLARGYSSALCFMALSLYYYIKFDFQRKDSYLDSLPLFFAGCSAIANFNFFYFFTAFSIIYFYRYHFKHGFRFLKNKLFYLDVLYVAMIVFLVLRALLFIKTCSNDIASFGGDDFINSTFGSFIDTLFYHQFYFLANVRFVLAATFLLCIVIAIVYGIIKSKIHDSLLYSSASLLLGMMILLVIFNHCVFNVLYPIERTAILFFPLIVIVSVQFLNSIVFQNTFKKLLLYSMSLVLTINFLVSARLVSGYDHSFCMNSKPYFDYLASTNAKKVGISVKLYFVFLKYYQYTNCYFKGEFINEYRVQERYRMNNKLEDFDYILLTPPYNIAYYKGSKVTLSAIKFFPETKGLVVKVTKH